MCSNDDQRIIQQLTHQHNMSIYLLFDYHNFKFMFNHVQMFHESIQMLNERGEKCCNFSLFRVHQKYQWYFVYSN